jgi:hypothetical protein
MYVALFQAVWIPSSLTGVWTIARPSENMQRAESGDIPVEIRVFDVRVTRFVDFNAFQVGSINAFSFQGLRERIL